MHDVPLDACARSENRNKKIKTEKSALVGVGFI